jgi:hypothetical protein
MVEQMSGSDSPIPHSLHKAVEKKQFGRSTCFLCGKRLGTKNRADEHVIPQWAQQRFRLHDQQMGLMNRSFIPYRKLTVPCCAVCNNECLQPIETAMAEASLEGRSGVASLEPHTVFLWLGKMFYGLLYKELFLAFDRSGSRSKTIATRELLRAFEMHHYFLQSCRVPMEFVDFHPASIFIFDAQESSVPEAGWDFRDDFFSLMIACRLGKVGMIAILEDGGAQRDFDTEMREVEESLVLHPVQFLELSARALYAGRLFNRHPKYVIIDGDPISVTQLPMGGLSSKPIFDEWKQEDYAVVLATLLEMKLDSIFVPPNQVMSWVRQANGEFFHMDWSKVPWPYWEERERVERQ